MRARGQLGDRVGQRVEALRDSLLAPPVYVVQFEPKLGDRGRLVLDQGLQRVQALVVLSLLASKLVVGNPQVAELRELEYVRERRAPTARSAALSSISAKPSP